MMSPNILLADIPRRRKEDGYFDMSGDRRAEPPFAAPVQPLPQHTGPKTKARGASAAGAKVPSAHGE